MKNTAGRRYSPTEFIPPSEYEAILEENQWIAPGQRVREIFLRCRESFLRERAQSDQTYGDGSNATWDGGQDKRGHQHQPIWPKIAKFCDEHAVDPELWIEALFSSWGELEPPYPTMFLSPKYLEYYEQQKPLMLRQLEMRLRWQMDLFMTKVHIWDTTRADVNKSIRAVLTNMSVDLMPMMRYLLAQTAKQQDVVEVMEESARIQVRGLRGLLAQTKWGALLPKEWMT